MNGKVDPAVLAALPPSMQLDLLVQMRERLMAENRQKYQKVKKVPAKFSELQIQAYLKTVAFRREIDEVQKSATGKGVGGVQTSRIASEANREFIFSSSFTGDKHVLTSAGVERNGEKPVQTPSEPPPSEPLGSIASSTKSNAETGSITDYPGRVFDDDIQTYLDERGHVRVSRVRAMGIRMTRDLQRNLDLMKEIDQDTGHTNEIANCASVLDKNAGGVSKSLPDKIQLKETSYQGRDESVCLDDRNEQSTSKTSNLMEISFEDDSGHKCLDDDDHLFARLVAGDPIMISSGGNSPSKKHSFDSDSDCEWEEGVIEDKGNSSTHDIKMESRLSLAEGGSTDEGEVQWEDGDSDVLKYTSTSAVKASKTASKGVLEEETYFQEAIRRSLEDLRGQKSSDASFEDGKLKEAIDKTHEITSVGFVHQENDITELNLPLENVERWDSEAGINMLNTDVSPGRQLAQSMIVHTDSMDGPIFESFERYPACHVEVFRQDTNEGGSLVGEIENKKSISPVEENGVPLIVEKLTSNAGGQVSTCATSCSGVTSGSPDMVLGETPHVILSDAQLNVSEATKNYSVLVQTEQGESSVKESTTNHEMIQKLAKGTNRDNIAEQRGVEIENITSKDDKEQPVEVIEASLEEEMVNVSKERIDLADEQRKLERNAESVSSEMFAECQELLQMFGLPYIIAPMEAEAQCAYMELANLVDGVVTDDSDVFLFGSKSVYKNIFDERKYVETYFMKDIESELGLSREKLIRMALLLGSDYTEGVSGIGIVNAIEVLNAFPEEDGLRKFREWIESPDPTILGKFDVQTESSLRKRGSKVSDNDDSFSNSNMDGLLASDQAVSHNVDQLPNTKQIFMDKHRNVSKNWHIPSSFPNEAVISAYASPQVDKSTEPFSWGKPDLFVLRKLCWEKFGWGTQKADELLLPVLKEYNKHETQLRLEAFYTFNERFAKIRSKRIKKAVKGITGNTSSELMDDLVQQASKSEFREDKSVKSVRGPEDCVNRDGSNSAQRSTGKRPRKRAHAEPVQSEVRNPEPWMRAKGRKNTSKGSSAKGKGRGIERGRAVGGGRRQKDTESSSNDGSSSNSEQEILVEKLEGPLGVRKSTRARKAVKYSLDDLDVDELEEENCSDKEAVQKPYEDHALVGDTATDPGEKNQHKVGDHSFEKGSGGDYLEMGGGFCMEEAEPELRTGQLNLGQNSDPHFEAEFSKEYLNTGGGLCPDEDGTTDPDIRSVQSISSPTKAPDGFEDRLRTDTCDGKLDLDSSTPIISDDRSSSVISPPENTRKDYSGTASINSLCAMPNLRRKRRKS
ncbi:hypothetical protein U1Q18_038398 [Sarracenia purpurea var. burkii]